MPRKKVDPRAVLDKLDSWLDKNGFARRVEYARPVSARAVTKAEKAIGLRFPPSYVELVTRHGTFTISGALTGRGDGNDTKLFGPEEAATATAEYRKRLASSRDTDSQEILADGLLFCADPIGEVFHLFVPSSADPNGEMMTRTYDYQDPANNDPPGEHEGDFASAIRDIADHVRENAEED